MISAVTSAQRARQLATSQNNSALAEAVKFHLKLYPSGVAFRATHGQKNPPESRARKIPRPGCGPALLGGATGGNYWMFYYCAGAFIRYIYQLEFGIIIMNAELCKRAVEKVGNPNVLVNLISRRVRQLNQGGGGLGRPLVDVPASMGLADIALTEILEDKMGWEVPEEVAAVRPVAKKRKKH